MVSNDNTGFNIPYSVRDTVDKGLGVFANAPIRKGTVFWRYVRGQYAVFNERSLKEFLKKLSHREVVYELTHMFGLPEFPGYVIRILDDGALINHSHQPNTAMNNLVADKEISYNTTLKNAQDVENALLNDRFALIAIQDINVGDELTMDYNVCVEDPSYYDVLYEQYDITEPFL